MKIDCSVNLKFTEELQKIINNISEQKKIISQTKQKLLCNSNVENIVASITVTEKHIDEELQNLLKFKRAIEKITNMYNQSEKKLLNRFDSNWTVFKPKFKPFTEFKINNGVIWKEN